MCPRGTFKMYAGDQACELCQPGYANDFLGADHPQWCQKCGPGTFNEEYGSNYCY